MLEILRENGINASHMVGQGYEGAAAMSGEHNGVQRHIHEKCPAASHGHCASHALNLCLVKAAKGKEIQVAVATMKAIITFFGAAGGAPM